MIQGEHYICHVKDHPVLTYGYVYTTTSTIQGNGLVRIMAYEWGTEYSVRPEVLKPVPLQLCPQWRIELQSKHWNERQGIQKTEKEISQETQTSNDRCFVKSNN